MRLFSHAPRRSRYRVLSTVIAALALVAAFLGTTAHGAQAATLLSQGRTATASSLENASFPASAAVDGNTGTRWSSAFSDPQWLEVDLGGTASISQVVLQWEAAYATAFQIQTSANGDGLDDDLLDDDRDRRHADAEHHRDRPVRPDVRHRPGHPVRLQPVGVPGVRRHRPAAARAAPPIPPSTSRPPRRPWRTPASPPRPRSMAIPPPAGPAGSATRSGSRSTSAPARRCAR